MIGAMARRNIWRNKRRSLLTCLSIAFGFWMAATFSSVANYSYVSMIDNGAKMGMGHLSLLHTDYLESPSTKETVRVGSILSLVQEWKTVRAALPRVLAAGMVATANQTLAANMTAIDPAMESSRTSLFLNYIVKGKMFTDSGRHCLVGASMAKKLNVDVGQKLVLTTTDKDGAVVSELFRVSGVFETKAKEIDDYNLVIPLGFAQDMMGYEKDEVTVASIVLHDHRDTKGVVRKIEGLEASGVQESLGVYPWQKTQPDLAGFVAIDQGSMRIFIIFITMLVALGVLNTMLMSVMERQKEFGVMVALGMGARKVIGMVLLESACLSLIGVVLGAALFVPAHYYMSTHGVDMSSMYGDGMTAGGTVFDTMIRSTIFAEQLGAIVIGLVLLSLFAAFYPAIRAYRVAPIDAIKVDH